MEEILEQMFTQLHKSYSESKTITDDLLMIFNFVFPSTFAFALDLIDKKNVTSITSKSGRSIFQVVGSSRTPYLCLSEGSFCECPAYKFSVVKFKDSLMCKHLLAVKLSQAMECFNELEVTEERMTDMLKTIE